jgi:large subunit ribosomal protein L3
MEKSQKKLDIRHAFIKVGMTNAFEEDGSAIGVTILKMQPGKVLRHEILDDGRTVVVVEYDTGKTNKLVRGWIAESASDYEVGSSLKSPEYTSGQLIKITGTSKGRGFQDVVTIYGFGGGPASHGSRFHRAPGSVGMRTEPGRVMKGKKMPRHDGREQITLKNVKVIKLSDDGTVLAVAGGVPGSRGSVVFI